MPLEVATHIGDLDEANPVFDDKEGKGDDHLRMVKLCLKTDISVEHAVTGTLAGQHLLANGDTASRSASHADGAGRIYLNTERFCGQRDDGTNWFDIFGSVYFLEPDAASSATNIVLEPAAPLPKAEQIDGTHQFPVPVLTRVAANSNGTAVTVSMRLADNSVSVLPLVKMDGTEIAAGELLAGHGIEIAHYPPINKWVLLSPVTDVTNLPSYFWTHSDYQLRKNGSNLELAPVKGQRIAIQDAGGTPTIYTYSNTPTVGPPASAVLQYVYAYDNSGALALEISTTGYATDSYGYRYKSGNKTRRLVGVAMPISSGGIQWVDTTAQRHVWSADNQPVRVATAALVGDQTIGALSFIDGCAGFEGIVTPPSMVVVPGMQVVGNYAGTINRTGGTGKCYGRIGIKYSGGGGIYNVAGPLLQLQISGLMPVGGGIMTSSPIPISSPDTFYVAFGSWVDSGTTLTVYDGLRVNIMGIG